MRSIASDAVAHKLQASTEKSKVISWRKPIICNTHGFYCVVFSHILEQFRYVIPDPQRRVCCTEKENGKSPLLLAFEVRITSQTNAYSETPAAIVFPMDFTKKNNEYAMQ